MPDIFAWARNLGRAALFNAAIGQTANLLAAHLDREGITPADLETAIIEGRSIVKDAIGKASAAEIAAVRATFGPIAEEFRKVHHAPDGTPWHPYKEMLMEDVMGVAHAAHVAVLERHQGWYREQMDAALAWLFGTPPAVGR